MNTVSRGAGGDPVEAVRGVDLDVAEGEILGFLGPNGAGKTTVLRMLTTLLVPTAGTATVAGHGLLTDLDGVRRSIGYVPQGASTDPECRVAEELVLQARLYGASAVESRRRASALAEQLDLGGLEQRLVKTLSGGQRRRLDVALGLVHGPRLVFLDEPTTGLDPQSRSNLWDHVHGLREHDGTTVFLTTHYLDEADALCDRVIVVDEGRVVAEGDPDALKREVARDVIIATMAPEELGAALAIAGRVVPDAEASSGGTEVRLAVAHGDAVVVDLLRALDAAGIVPVSLEVRRPTLDDVFLTLTGRSLRDAQAVAA